MDQLIGISLNGSSQAVNSNITALGANIAAATFEITIATTDTRQQRYWAGYTRSTPPRFAILQNDDAANQQTLHLEYRSSQNVTRRHIFNVAGANLWNGEWHHVVFVTNFASNQASLYIDGSLRGAVVSESDSGSFGAWTASPCIGARIITHYHTLP